MTRLKLSLAAFAVFTALSSPALAGPLSYVATNGGAIYIVDTGTQSVTGTITTGGILNGIVVTPDGSKLYAAASSTNQIIVVDIASRSVTSVIPAGSVSGRIAITPDGSKVYALMNNGAATYNGSPSCTFPTCDAVWVITTSTNQVTAQVNTGLVCGPPVNNAPRSIPSCGGGGDLVASPDGTRIYSAQGYANEVAVISTATDTVVASPQTGMGGGLALSTDGTRLYQFALYNRGLMTIDTSTFAILAADFFPPSPCVTPEEIGLSPDGASVWLACVDSGTVSVVDAHTYALLGNVNIGQTPWSISFTADGTDALIPAGGAGGGLYVVQVSDLLVLSNIPAGYAPVAVAVSKANRYHVCALYDSTKAVNSGAVLPVKLELCDANGADLSSSGLVLHATGVTKVSTATTGQIQSSGNSNPDNDFRYDSTLGASGGYIFNLSTKGLTTGSYTLNFTVTGDAAPYTAPFQVK